MMFGFYGGPVMFEVAGLRNSRRLGECGAIIRDGRSLSSAFEGQAPRSGGEAGARLI